MTGDTTMYLVKAITKKCPNTKSMPTTANEIKNIINSLISKNVYGYD
jgi:hypothetical protein